jgi:hypothetical protein
MQAGHRSCTPAKANDRDDNAEPQQSPAAIAAGSTPRKILMEQAQNDAIPVKQPPVLFKKPRPP